VVSVFLISRKFTIFIARCQAERRIATASRPSVCPSVCDVLRYHDHIGCNTANGWVASAFFSLPTPISRIYSKCTRQHFRTNRGGYGKSGFRRIKALISLKQGKIEPSLLFLTNRTSYTRFRLVPTTFMTLHLVVSHLICSYIVNDYHQISNVILQGRCYYVRPWPIRTWSK